ncbi:MAG: DUF2062 domain-containing protein [Oligoflexia bacterium]|nr:DUF2062 domain-containing protein [Oligoflexia bacterium]
MNSIKLFIKNILKIKDSKEAIARGVAIGFFWGVSVFWGGQIAGAIATSYFFKGNKVISAAMTAISNPITNIPLYTFCYIIGHLIVPGPDLESVVSNLHSLKEIMNQGGSFFITMFLGTTLIGIVGAVTLYFIVKKLNLWKDKN